MINLSKENTYTLLNKYSYFIDHKEEAEEFFQTKWELLSEYASILWSFRYNTKVWTEEELKILEIKYFYYIDHKDEAELYFKTIWNSIETKASKLGFNYVKHNWKKEEIKDLKDNYYYYVNHTDEAKVHFKRRWSVINKKALNLGLLYYDWTDEELKELSEKYFYYLEHKNEAELYFKRLWESIHSKAVQLKITSMKINKKCSVFLGCYVAERVLSHVFKEVERMPFNNPGFDFICNKGFKIDVKSSCLRINNQYNFNINQNEIPDYFLLIGFDNRVDLNPQRIWLIKGNLLNKLKSVTILNNVNGLSKYSKYELTDKLKETIECCSELKSNKIN